jgi:ribosome-associated protein
MPVITTDFSAEFEFQASRSSGAGGQNVNKVATKVELRFHVMNSVILSETEKTTLMEKLAAKINQEGWLIVVSQATRSQLKNKELAIQKFYELLTKAFHVPKKRKPTRPTLASKEKRLQSKKKEAQKKNNRGKPAF